MCIRDSFKTKPINEITKNDLDLLEKLKKEHLIEIEKAKQKNETVIDLNYEGNCLLYTSRCV